MYMDLLFFLNWMMDLLVLLLAGGLCRRGRIKDGLGRGRRLRLCLSAAAGALGSCLLTGAQLLLGVRWLGQGAGALLSGLILAGIMSAIAWNPGTPSAFFRRLLAVYASAFVIGGVCGWLQARLRTAPYVGILLAATAISILGCEWFSRLQEKKSRFATVRICCGGNVVRVQGLIDTGNSLTLPKAYGGGDQTPVSVIWREALAPALSEAQLAAYDCMRAALHGKESKHTGAGKAPYALHGGKDADTGLLEAAAARIPGKERGAAVPMAGWRYVPYRSVGCAGGLLPAFRADHVYICMEEQERHIGSVWLAVCEQPVSSQGRYGLLLHPGLLSHME